MMARHGTRSRKSRRLGASTAVVDSLINHLREALRAGPGPPAAPPFLLSTSSLLRAGLGLRLGQLQRCLEDRIEVAVHDLVHRHRGGLLAVTVLVTGEAAGDALEPG